jgi:hypothetical protein
LPKEERQSRHQCSSDESVTLLGTSHHERQERRNHRRAQRKQERNLRRQRGAVHSSTWGPYSIIVTVLFLGLVGTFLEVLNIMNHLETSTSLSDLASFSTEIEHSQRISKPHVQTNVNMTALVEAKGPILDLIREAGITFDLVEDADLLEELPDWDDVVHLYGPEPVLYGVNEENCKRFQMHSDPWDHFLGVAGTFNSGTNLMAELLIHNCYMPERIKKYGSKNIGIRWQVPWGKHTPPGDKKYRNEHKSKKDRNVDAGEIMPAVTIRDPLIWLKSMCKHQYTARWYRPNPNHCPDFMSKPTTTSVKYADFRKVHESILHHWNDYYQEYLHVDIPIMMVRFEDLVFHPKETTRKICECAGGEMRRTKFNYIVESAKKGVGAHGKVRVL